jgi:hypothetical protein
MAFKYRFELENGDPADPPTIEAAVPNWAPGDTIPLGANSSLGGGYSRKRGTERKLGPSRQAGVGAQPGAAGSRSTGEAGSGLRGSHWARLNLLSRSLGRDNDWRQSPVPRLPLRASRPTASGRASTRHVFPRGTRRMSLPCEAHASSPSGCQLRSSPTSSPQAPRRRNGCGRFSDGSRRDTGESRPRGSP